MARKVKFDLRSPRDVAKFHESVANHPNADVRLAADNVALAFKAAKSGDVQGFLTYIDLAALFSKNVNFHNPEVSY